ncbi:MAG: cysteine peptidase family C39 domain-containing protein, partial [Flammeovirgaceae bacterium]
MQRDQADCGVACLATVINFYQGLFTFEELRKAS